MERVRKVKARFRKKVRRFSLNLRKPSYIFQLMARPGTLKPTEAELEILKVLWRRGPSTVREVHEALDGRDVGYTTVLKFLQIMTAKGLVLRDDSLRSHIYRPRHSEERTQRAIAGDILKRVFDGSAEKLILRALSAKRASPEDLAEIRRLLDRLEGGKR